MLKQFIAYLIIFSVCSVLTSATEKTLPKGVFKFDLYNNQFDIEKLGANPSGDKVTWKTVDLKDGKMSDIYLFHYIRNLGLGINLDTKLANSWEKSVLHLDFAYGITDKLTFFANLSHERAKLDYTKAYVDVGNRINDEDTLAATYNSPPDAAEADHLNDTFIGLKYQFNHASLAFKMTDGFLMTGNDSEEKDSADGVQELETSRGYNQYHLYFFKNLSVFNQPIEFTFGHIFLGKMTQIFLDNKSINFNPGNMNILKFNMPLSVHEKITLNSSFVLLYHRTDKYKGGNSEFSNTNPNTKAGYTTWTDVPNSNGYVQMAKFEVVYQPAIFLRLFVNSNIILSNDATGQLYNFPGRIQPGNMMAFGMTLFAK